MHLQVFQHVLLLLQTLFILVCTFKYPLLKFLFIFCLTRTLPPDYKLSLILNL